MEDAAASNNQPARWQQWSREAVELGGGEAHWYSKSDGQAEVDVKVGDEELLATMLSKRSIARQEAPTCNAYAATAGICEVGLHMESEDLDPPTEDPQMCASSVILYGAYLEPVHEKNSAQLDGQAARLDQPSRFRAA
eukprot:148566-Amphidinium_carterae.1